MCICCVDVDCMHAYMILISPNDSPHGAYCFYYVRMYVTMYMYNNGVVRTGSLEHTHKSKTEYGE